MADKSPEQLPRREIVPEVAREPARILLNPPIDIHESAEGLVLCADLPGVTVDSLELQIQDNKLSLLGHSVSSIPAEGILLHREYEDGDYVRSFILSDEVDHARIAAKLHQGVLEIQLPKAARSPARRIQVDTGG